MKEVVHTRKSRVLFFAASMASRGLPLMGRLTGIWCLLGCILPSHLERSFGAMTGDEYRLESEVMPLKEAIDLRLDPSQERYEGTVQVQLEFLRATNRFRFHALDMDLERVTLDGKNLEITLGEAGLVSAVASGSVPAGLHGLEISFKNDFNRDGSGLYKLRSGTNDYLFTQMEATDARRAFPCWDEPQFKIPWQLSATIPAEFEMVGNMPVAQSRVSDGKKRLEFGRTPPMPSYLVAFAVGTFDAVKIERQSIPGSVYTPAGQGQLASFAAREIPGLLSELERSFQLPYPYAKLDHIAVPGFPFGAMENAGLITYKDNLLLGDEKTMGFEDQRFRLMVMAHEMAHLWFGDLVTMKWWDDLWLNESFASWMSYKIATKAHPELRFDVMDYKEILKACIADTQPSVKPIRRHFRGNDNVLEAVDELTYNKGQAILRMTEAWLGEDKVQKAVRNYFLRHRWGNTEAGDLWAAFAEESGAAVAEVLQDYIEQPGLPQLVFKRLPNDQLEVRQERYRTIIGAPVEQTWHVPILLKYGSGESVQIARLLLTNTSARFSVPRLDRAQWLYPNSDEAGYYTWSLPDDLSKALAEQRSRLSTVERVGFLAAADLALRAGELKPSIQAKLLESFAGDDDPEVQEKVVSGFVSFGHLFAHTESERASFAEIMRRVLRPMLDRIGFEGRAGQAPEWDSIRSDLLGALGVQGHDPEVISFCRQVAKKHLENPRAVGSSLAEAALRVAAWHGDAEWLAKMKDAFESASAPDIRARYLQTLVLHRDEKLVRDGCEYLLTDAVRSTEVLPALRTKQPDLAGVIFQWIREDYSALEKKVRNDLLPRLPGFLAGGDEKFLVEGREFFLAPGRATPLAEVQMKKASEAGSCAALFANVIRGTSRLISPGMGDRVRRPRAIRQ